MNIDFSDLEVLWDYLLSGQTELVRAAFEALNELERKAVFNHLRRMVSEPGWQPEQRTSAQTALLIIQPLYFPDVDL